jgi:hypothetical protein
VARPGPRRRLASGVQAGTGIGIAISPTQGEGRQHPPTLEGILAGILWTVLVVLLILWALGFFVAHLGSIIHALLVIALIVLIVNLLTGRGATV